MTRTIVVMGVSGCGKSTLGSELARALDWTFIEGDQLHPPENVAKMAAGVPLDDRDREPFLRNVAEALGRHPQGAVAACSALRRSYRDLVRAEARETLFVLPMLGRATLEARMRDRPGHFMPVSLLDSQLATLELPDPDEVAVTIDGEAPLEQQVADVLAMLTRLGTPRG